MFFNNEKPASGRFHNFLKGKKMPQKANNHLYPKKIGVNTFFS